MSSAKTDASDSASDSSVECVGVYDSQKRKIDIVLSSDSDSDSSCESTTGQLSSRSKSSIVAHPKRTKIIYISDDTENEDESDEENATKNNGGVEVEDEFCQE